jgi:hypothetical protein
VPEGLGRIAAKYTVLRLSILALSFGVACAVLLPWLGSTTATLFKAVLVAFVVSIPLSFFLGRSLRDQMTAALDVQRRASKARVDDTAARVRAVEERRRQE